MVDLAISIVEGGYVVEVYHGPSKHVPRVGDKVPHGKGGWETVVEVRWTFGGGRPFVAVVLGRPSL